MEGPFWSVMRNASFQHFSSGTPAFALTVNQSHHPNQERLDLKEQEL